MDILTFNVEMWKLSSLIGLVEGWQATFRKVLVLWCVNIHFEQSCHKEYVLEGACSSVSPRAIISLGSLTRSIYCIKIHSDFVMGASLTKEEKFVWYVVCPQSFSGLAMSGLFYGWGALNGEDSILRI